MRKADSSGLRSHLLNKGFGLALFRSAFSGEVVHDVIDFEGASESKWPDRVEQLTEVHPGESLVHAVDVCRTSS